jgi:DNA-binding CsgD family transcriptional regulator
MRQQGQVFAMKSNRSSGAPLWGYRYRTGGRGSRRVQRGGFVSERDASESLGRALERVRRANGTGSTLTLAGLVDEYLPQLSPAQRRVLVALCRPYAGGAAFARPATNQQIADELFLSIPAVKTHLRSLFERFGLGNLPQNEKRARLVQVALDCGAVTSAELVAPP